MFVKGMRLPHVMWVAEDIKPSTREQILRHLQGRPELLAYADGYFSGEAEARKLFAAVDESIFGLADWMEALRVLDDWLVERQLDLGLEHRLDYVCCVAEAGSAAAGMADLASLTGEMLSAYGCERAVKKS